MKRKGLPPQAEMIKAFLAGDADYDGVFYTAVKTTGIFCRPACRARKPKVENVEFFATGEEAIAAGYRSCKRCRPQEESGTVPSWLRPLVSAIDAEPSRRWTDAGLRGLGLQPERVRRWFQSNLGTTFHAHDRERRLGMALGRLGEGDGVLSTAMDSGYDSLSGFNTALKRLAGDSPGRSRTTTVVRLTRIATPLGPMIAGATDEAACFLEYTERDRLDRQLESLRRSVGAVTAPGDNEVLAQLRDELDAYFAGRLRRFRVPLLTPGTAFQRGVWKALRGIPHGRTVSYAELARDIGRPAAARAVARANGDNRMAIVIPCHRVIGSDGKLSGYGGGAWRKQRLLELEGAFAQTAVSGV